MFKYRCGQCGAEIISTTDSAGSACPHCGIAISNSDPGSVLPSGFVLGGFEVIRKIGCGSSGIVYQANQLSMGRSVALKVLYSSMTQDRTVISQFFEEVKILGQIQHPNIVCALEAGTDQGLYFLAMQYIAGTTLEEYLNASGAMKPETALAIIGVVAQALQYVWNKYHFCHRDIKPGNIMIDEDDKPVILDFGTALRSGENSVRNGMIEGSPYYMSPEQICGGVLSFSSDMYSLGTTLYHMLAGAAPFFDPDVNKILQMHCSASFPTFEERGVSVPQSVSALVRKMMAKSPQERYGSWEEFLDALAEVRKSLKKKKPVPGTPKRKDAAAAIGQASYSRGLQTQAAAAAPVKKGVSAITIMGNLISLAIIVGMVCYVMARNNNISTLNQLDSAKRAYNNVQSQGSSPEHAIQLFKKAKSFSLKFGVKDQTVQDVNAAYESCVSDLEAMMEETKRSEELHSQARQMIRAAGNSLTEFLQLQGNAPVSTEKLEKMLVSLEGCEKNIARLHFRIALNRERSEQDVALLQQTRAEIEGKIGKKASVTERKAPEKIVRTKVSAEEERLMLMEIEEEEKEKSAQDETAAPGSGETAEKERKEDDAEQDFVKRYKSQARKFLANMECDLIRSVRKQDLKGAKAVLTIPESLLSDKPSVSAERKKMEDTASRLRSILEKAGPVLRKAGGGLDRREAIREAARSDPERQYCAFLLCGYFSEASGLMPKKDGELFDGLARAYLRPRIIRALNNAKQGRTAELEELRSDYENFELYRKLENEISRRQQ